MRKVKKIMVPFLCIMMGLSLLCGCGKSSGGSKNSNYETGSKKISVNFMKDQIVLSKVDFYDIMKEKKISALSGTFIAVSNSYNTTELVIQTSTGSTYCIDTYYIATDIALGKFPSSFKVYTNESKSSYDTYKKK